MRNVLSSKKTLGALALPVIGYFAWKNRDKIRAFVNSRFPSVEGDTTTQSTGTDINS